MSAAAPRKLVIVAVALIMLTLTTSCAATLNYKSPFSWTAKTPNGNFIFAGVSQLSVDDQLRLAAESGADETRLAEMEAAIRDIHERFPVTGMYRSEDTSKPVWALEFWVGNGLPSSDGQHLVVPGGGLATTSQLDVVNIYSSDGTKFEVWFTDLVPRWQLVLRRVFSENDLTCESIVVGDDGDRLIIETNYGDIVEFSLNDKRKLMSRVLPNTVRTIYHSTLGKFVFIVILVMSYAIGYRLWRKKRDVRSCWSNALLKIYGLR